MRTRLVLLALAAAIVTMLAATSSASAISRPQVFSLLGRPEAFVPIEGMSATAPPEIGARFIFQEGMYQWAGRKRGPRVGHLEGLCTVTGTGERTPSYCTASYVLPRGQILVAVFARFPVGPVGARVPVVGGTGAYANARGYVRVRDLPGGKTNNEFHLLP